MAGKDAKWADMGKLSEIKRPYTKPDVRALRSAIKVHEEPIPKPTQDEIHALIAKLRVNGHKENKIRRIVKNTFHITVI